jgi:hypothetical protein
MSEEEVALVFKLRQGASMVSNCWMDDQMDDGWMVGQSVCGSMMIGRWGSCAGLSLIRINSLSKLLLMPGWRQVAVQFSTNS